MNKKIKKKLCNNKYRYIVRIKINNKNISALMFMGMVYNKQI